MIEEIKKEFVEYEEALVLRQMGFNEPCFGYYNEEYLDGTNPQPISLVIEYNKRSSNVFYMIPAPLYQQAFKWFRTKHNLDIIIPPCGDSNLKTIGYFYEIMMGENTPNIESEDFKTYEEAELACLKKLIEITKTL